MTTILAPHLPHDLDKLSALTMAAMNGAVFSVRCVDGGDGLWYALEGSHRIAAAHDAGVMVDIIPVEYGDADLRDVLGEQAPEDYATVAEWCDVVSAASDQASYTFEA